MEAMWTRFLPIIEKVRDWVNKGAIGEINIVMADFGFKKVGAHAEKKFSFNLGRGALLDVGVYPISFSSMIYGTYPRSITGITCLNETKIDEQSAMLLGFEKGQMAILSCAINTLTPQEARINGTKGSIYIPDFYRATKAVLSIEGTEPITFEMPFKGNGYEYEAAAVMNCLKEGRLESNIMPLEESLSIMRIMDKLKNDWGIKYPSEF
jgi:dihydrodiol dehydrogenase / D-xylose 1-dehydrogenase (NADP)